MVVVAAGGRLVAPAAGAEIMPLQDTLGSNSLSVR